MKKRSFYLYTFLKLFSMIISLISNMIIIRKLSIPDFGIFSVILMINGLLTTFGFSWSSSSILYFGSKEKLEFGNINKTFWSRNIIIGFSLFFVGIMFIFFKDKINAYIGIKTALYIYIWLFVSVGEDFLCQYFLAIDKQILSSILSSVSKLIYLLIVLLFSFTVKGLLIINIVSHFSVFFFILQIDKKDIGVFIYDKKWFKEILNFSLWQLFGYSGLYLINFGDTAVIKHFMETDDIAIYNSAYKLFSTCASFSYIILNFFTSTINKSFIDKNKKRINSFYYKDRFYIFFASLIVHIIMFIFAKQIFIFIFGLRYINAINIFRILLIGSLFRYLSVFYTVYYNSTKQYKVLQNVNIVRAFVNLILDVVLIKRVGLIGPAIATSLSIFLTFVFSMIYCERNIYWFSKSNDEDEKCTVY